MKVLVVDDHMLVREGLRQVLQSLDEGGLDMIEAATGAEGMAALSAHPDIDLVLLDLHLPDRSGLDLLAEMGKRCPDLPIVVLSGEENSEVMKASIDRGAMGFIPKASLSTVLVSALQLVFSGCVYIPPQTLDGSRSPPLMPALSLSADTAGGLRLTPRQREVLELLLDGKSNKEICKLLDLAEPTVKNHVSAILRELGVTTRSQAIVAMSRRAGVSLGAVGEKQPAG